MARFVLHIWDMDQARVPVFMSKADKRDLEATMADPWQTDWSSEYITTNRFDLYALKTMEGALVALGVYGVRKENLAIHVIYMIYIESEPESNPTRTAVPKYRDVGRAMVAYGIKLSVDAGFNGDVTLDAKAPELARHYERAIGAFRVPRRERDVAPRYLICDEAAKMIFTDYLEEG